MTDWLSQAAPPTAYNAPRFWHSVADMVAKSNYANTRIPTRQLPVGMPQAWQPPLSTNVAADAALKDLPQ